MIRKLGIVSISLVLVSLIGLAFAPRTPTTTTIPPISAQSPGVQLQCDPLQAFPGSVNIGASGFIRIRCPDKNGAVTFGIQGQPTATLTPTFTLGIGYVNASIIRADSAGNPCNFIFRTVLVGNVTVSTGSFLTHPIIFGNPPTNSSELLATNYDYCLQYVNAPVTGLPGFSIAWT